MKFHQTYEVVTDESAEQGDTDETGFDWQDVSYTFKELVHLLSFEYAGAEPSDYRDGQSELVVPSRASLFINTVL
ncbi:hypothetical protein [Burkholderia cepacia]|uniref:hypothetical protein n=1 Tax=Burkholderia cepacia TaxID=292 RepID=UPI00158A11C9|nr:hypothetical protein [Burkholderia cepacia]MDN7901169.1 hypothetical protein [Burkholderia cepacia]